MAIIKTPILDSSGKIVDASLPDRLKVEELSATYGPEAAGMLAAFALRSEVSIRQAGLAAMDAMLLNRQSAPVVGVWLGDSHGRGVGASQVFDRMFSRTEKVFQRTWNPENVAGGYTVLGVDVDAWVSGGTLGTAARGIALESRTIPSGAWIQHSARSATSFTIHYAQGPGVGPFSVSIDNGSAVTVTPDGTGALRHTGVWSSGLLTRGQHTIRITGTGASSAEINTVRVFDQDEDRGVHLYNGAKGGTYLQQHIAAGTSDTLWQRFAILNPGFVILEFGSNEYSIQRPLADFRADLDAALALIDANTTSDPWIAVVGMHNRTQASLTIPYADYLAVLADFAADNPTRVTFHNLAPKFPTTQAADAADLIGSDNSHLTSKGHAYAVDILAKEWELTSRDGEVVRRPVVTESLKLIADFNADTLTGADLSAVTSWAPAAGMETLPLIQTDAAKQPVLKVAGINGHKAVEFTDDAMGVDWPSDWNTPLTLVYVGSRYRFDTGTMIGTMNGQGVLTAGFSTSLGFTFGGGAVNEATFSGINTTPLDGPLVIVAVYDGANSRFYINTLTARTGTVTAGKIGALRLGDNSLLNNPVNPWTVTRVQAYGRALTDAECQSIISAHATTYALTLS